MENESRRLIDNRRSMFGGGLMVVGASIATLTFGAMCFDGLVGDDNVDYSKYLAVTTTAAAAGLAGKYLQDSYQNTYENDIEAIEKNKEASKNWKYMSLAAGSLGAAAFTLTIGQSFLGTSEPTDAFTEETTSITQEQVVNTENQSANETTTTQLGQPDIEYSTDKYVINAVGERISFVEYIGVQELYDCKLSIIPNGEGLYFTEGKKAVSDITDLETSLIRLGYLDGPATGNEKGNNKFESALNRFETQNGFDSELRITEEVCGLFPWLVDGRIDTP